MKKASKILSVISWIFGAGCVAFIEFLTFTPFREGLSFWKDILLRKTPTLFNFVGFGEMLQWYPLTLCVFQGILLIGLIFIIIEFILIGKKKKGSAIIRTFLYGILTFGLAVEAIAFIYPGQSRLSTETFVDGYGLIKICLDNINGGTTALWPDTVIALAPVACTALALIFAFIGELMQIFYLSSLSSNQQESAITNNNSKEGNGSNEPVIYTDRHITIQYFNNFANSIDEDTLRRIIREELSNIVISGSQVSTSKSDPALSKQKEEIPESYESDEDEIDSEDEDGDNESSDKKKIIRIPFNERMKTADKGMVDHYNELKSYIMAYGVNSRVSNSGDAFRLHTKTYVKISIAGKSLKLYLALNPKDYENSTIPVGDASGKGIYAEIPAIFKVKSDLSLKRAKQLIDDAMRVDNLQQSEIEMKNWAKDFE